jgi:Transglycosylase SLT domain
MPELPKISEDFTADATGYLAALQAMIDQTERLTAEVAALHDEIDDLPDVKNIEINVTGDAIDTITAIQEDINALDGKTILINVVYKRLGDLPDTIAPLQEVVDVTTTGADNLDVMKETAEELEQIGEAFDEASNAGNNFRDVTTLDAAAQEVLNNVLNDTSLNAQQQAAALKNVTDAMRESRIETENAIEAEDALTASARKDADAFDSNLASIHDQIMGLQEESNETNLSAAAMDKQAAAAFEVDEAIRQARAEVVEITSAEENYAQTIGFVQDVQESVRDSYLDTKVAQAEMMQETIDSENAFREQSEAVNQLSEDIHDGADNTEAFTNNWMKNNSAIIKGNEAIDQANQSLLRMQMMINGLGMVEAKMVGDQDTFNGLLQQSQSYARLLGDNVNDTSGNVATLAAQLVKGGGDARVFLNAIEQGHGDMDAFMIAAKAAGDNVGGMLIQLGAAAFGVTSLGTAIHLVVMGSFEFLAVFIPAMYAAAAATAVLLQGADQVYNGLRSVEDVGESLGPTFGKTQGDMIGLGHSLQVAQNAADPDAYELLGEAVRGVNESTGHLNTQLGNVSHNASSAGQGISTFGQLGEGVGNILEQFGAKVDMDLNSNVGEITSILSKAGSDLVEFGQIFGNLGHAILNFAADMPGIAEVVLKLLDAFTFLIKGISDLPPMLITVAFGIEEAYRWSGLLVGLLGVLGRAFSLIGTLGIPVIAKIGMNFGQMVGNLISGVEGMVINVTGGWQKLKAAITANDDEIATSTAQTAESMETSNAEAAASQRELAESVAAMSGVTVEEYGVMTGATEADMAKMALATTAADTEMVASTEAASTGMAASLGTAADFMTGPWGAAILLGVAGAVALMIAMNHTQSATQKFITSINNAVSSASNMTVLNTIANGMSQVSQKLIQQQQQVINLNGPYAESTQKVVEAQNEQGHAMNQVMGGYSNMGFQIDTVTKTTKGLTLAQAQQNLVMQSAPADINPVTGGLSGLGDKVVAVSANISELTGEQTKLFGQANNVIQGAQAISNEYGVSFTTALGLATTAGVNLSKSQVGFGKNITQAGIQIESLVQGYGALTQSGTTLANSTNAVSIAAGIQGSKIDTVNQAWDSFISTSTGVTSAFSSLQDDMQQLSSVADPAGLGKKIQAFSGTTVLSVGQVAKALQSFGGTSSQIWQSFDQSVTQANSFADSLRTGMVAGVVSSKDYTEGIAGVVQELLPYASKSSAALAEVDALAQEAGGPATTSLSSLKDWVDKNAVSSDKFNGMINKVTQGLSNVTTVAQTFASTLQTDVVNAIASAGVNTSNVTGLTQKFTESLMQNGLQAGQTQQAQAAFNSELQKLGFTHTQVTQLDNELTNAYGGNESAADQVADATDTLGDKMDEMKNGHLQPLTEETIANTNKTTAMAQEMGIDVPAKLGKAGSAADQASHGPLTTLQQALQSIKNWAKQMEDQIEKMPSQEHTNVRVTGSGGATVKSNVPGVPSGSVGIVAAAQSLGLAAGGVIPGYNPGHDSVHALLSPGEGVLIPQAVKALGGEQGINHINQTAQRFAEGGIVLPDIGEAAGAIVNKSATAITDAYGQILNDAVKVIVGKSQSEQAIEGTTAQLHPSGSFESWVAQAEAAAGVSGAAWTNGINLIAMYESGYNSNAINLSDSNAAAGDPSRGLMQLIMTTFDAYHVAGTSDDIYNPVANIAAAIRYIEARYGGINNVPGIVSVNHGGGYIGYDQGGWLMPGMNLAFNGTGQPEKITSPTGYGPNDSGQMLHAVFNIDGKKVFEALQPAALQYAAKNRGNGNIGAAGFAPNR